MKQAAIMLAALFLSACASPPPGPAAIEVAPGSYAAAFDAAREVLRAARFHVDRVDAAGGTISTEPKTTAGLATPWDREQSTFGQEVEDFLNHQRRIVRITFEPEDARTRGPADGPLGEGPAWTDLRDYRGGLVARVMVVVERIHRPGWRIETVSIASSSFTRDPALGPRGIAAPYWVPVARDPALEARLAARLAARIPEQAR